MPSIWASVHALGHLAEEILESIGVERELGTTQREVHLEYRLERSPMRVVLHERGAEGVLERLAVFERDVLDRLHGVEVLGEAHGEPRIAQLDDEPRQELEHRRVARCDGFGGHVASRLQTLEDAGPFLKGTFSDDSSLVALAMSV